MRQRLVSLLLLTLLLAAPARGQSGPQLTQSAVAGGGGGASAQGAFRVEGTIGQGVVGASSGGVFSLDGGFVLALANRAPVNSAPATHATNEDTPLVFGGASSVSVSDPDAGAGLARVTLTAVNGTLTLGSTAGLIFMSGAGAAGDAQLIFDGTLADVNAALAGLTFTPAPDFHGSASLNIQTNDLGHTGEGGAQQDADTVNITVNPVNDPPAAAPQSVATDEEVAAAVTLSGSDAETPAAGLAFTVTAQPTHGSLSGTAPNLTYTPADGYAGPDSFKFTVTDAGDGAAAPLTSAEATVSINVAAVPDISVHDARAAEPKSGEAPMLFTVTLERAPASAVTVDFATSLAGGATASASDFTPANGTLTFAPGQRVQTVSVAVLHDNQPEPDETFRLQLSNASGGRIAGGGTANGTITPSSPAGAILISELRTFGPGAANDPGDQFVEVYNNSDAAVKVSTGDGSPGWGLFKAGADCDATPVLVGVIPNGTDIPARGHFLFAGPAYSLADYGGAGAAEGDAGLEPSIEPNRSLGLFRTTDVGNLSSVTRLDAVGFGAGAANNCALLREGNGLGEVSANVSALGQHSFFRKLCDFVNGKGCQANGTPKDTHDNAADFAFADTTGTEVAGVGQLLGAPGPENLASPIQTNLITVALLDGSLGGPAPPNRVRSPNDNPLPGITNAGTMSIRRRVINHTGAPVSRLRFRISEFTTYPRAEGAADLRALDSAPVSDISITNDSGTCGGPPSCTVTVAGTTLEQEPTQGAGGGLNATLTVTLGTPLAADDHVLVHFRLGVRQTGLFRFYVVTETLP